MSKKSECAGGDLGNRRNVLVSWQNPAGKMRGTHWDLAGGAFREVMKVS
jgi:hypothetical protein